VAKQIGALPIYLSQVHGTKGVTISPGLSCTTEADVAWTSEVGLACTMMVADCLPILVCHKSLPWVAAAHAGWRGLAGSKGEGVVETLAQAVAAQGMLVQDCLIWLGPCIGPRAFEVGVDVRDAFLESPMKMSVETCFQPMGSGKYGADLAGLARLRLQAVGFYDLYGNDSSPVWCTYSAVGEYHSHRRDAAQRGGAGRMAAYVWITA
jgi:YfiH family protein